MAHPCPSSHRAGCSSGARWARSRDAALEAYRRTVATGAPFGCEYRIVDGEGRVRWFQDEAVAVDAMDGHPVEIRGVIYETTARKQAELAMRASERALGEAEDRYRNLVEQLPL